MSDEEITELSESVYKYLAEKSRRPTKAWLQGIFKADLRSMTAALERLGDRVSSTRQSGSRVFFVKIEATQRYIRPFTAYRTPKLMTEIEKKLEQHRLDNPSGLSKGL